ncbi:MAG: TlpA family protein disulfide reductase [Vulcanimicrobiaceae bacterium]
MSKRQIIAPAEVNRRAQRNRLFLYLTLGLIVVIIVAVVAFYSRVPQAASSAPIQSNIKVGQTAPEFSVATTNGPFDLKTAESAGKPVFLEIFATWCPHCQREVTTIDALYKKYGSQMDFVGVSGSPTGMDGQAPSSQLDVVNFQKTFGVRYPIAYDPGLDVAGKYMLDGYPSLVIVDKTGKVAYLASGEISDKTLTTEIEKVLK